MIDSHERDDLWGIGEIGGEEAKTHNTDFYSDSRVSVDPSKSSGNAVKPRWIGDGAGLRAQERKRKMSGGKSRVEDDRGWGEVLGSRDGGRREGLPRRLVEVPSTRSSRQEQRCHRVVWLISRFESSGVVLLVIPRGARRPVTGRGERQREGIVRVERTCWKSGGVRTRGCAMRGRECRWRLFGVNGGWWEEAPERVIESRARSLLYRPPYAVPFPRTLPP